MGMGRGIVFRAVVLAIGCGMAGAQPPEGERAEVNVPIRAITEGPDAHWFGYYDKHQFDPSGRYVLGMQVGFEDRPPEPDDVIELGMVDTAEEDRWIRIGETRAWGWQQGCMLQWLPGSDSQVIYNDRRNGRFVAVVKDVFEHHEWVIDYPIYAVSPDGKWGITVNFARLDATRPGYGYAGLADPHEGKLAPEDDGLYLVDLESGEAKLTYSLADVSQIAPKPSMETGKHWFNHLLFNPRGNRFIFLHRWKSDPENPHRWSTRMLTGGVDGSEPFVIADHNLVSHFIWRDPEHILAWSREPETGARFHLYTDESDAVAVVGEGVLKQDGHCTYSPDGEWILTDTYPDSARMQTLMLYRPSDDRLEVLGKFFMPRVSESQLRCDLHPRWSRDGTRVCIDSMHSGTRQMYVLDVSGIVGD